MNDSVNEYLYTHTSIMHALPYQRVRTWEGPTGAGGRRIVCYKPHTRPPCWVGRGPLDYAQCFGPCGEESTVTA